MPVMDENRPAYSLKALGTAGAALRLPGRGSFPDVDDHLVEARARIVSKAGTNSAGI
jgi:hypothetical protein